jgi:hypothetical protein
MLQIDTTIENRSWIEGARERFDAANDPLVLPTRSLLGHIIAEPEIHGRFINTLALLEHLGSHRIMATQHSERIDQATLRHAAEEAHHAYFMKRQAEKSAGRPLTFDRAELLGSATAKSYFRRLEAVLFARLRRQHSADATYLYMSMIIEFRALWFYGLYQQSLKLAGHAMSLKRILGEEEHHLDDMAQRLGLAGELSNARVEYFLDVENRLYARLLGAMRHDLDVATLA